jgi:hypothetical protein
VGLGWLVCDGFPLKQRGGTFGRISHPVDLAVGIYSILDNSVRGCVRAVDTMISGAFWSRSTFRCKVIFQTCIAD